MVWIWSIAIVLAGMYLVPLGLSYYYMWRDTNEGRGQRRFAPTQGHMPHGV